MNRRDVKALNIPRQREVKLNELTKQVFMPLPLLLHWLYCFIFWGLPGAPGPRPPKNEKLKPMKQQRQRHKNLLWQFIQLNILLPRNVKGEIFVNIPMSSLGLDSDIRLAVAPQKPDHDDKNLSFSLKEYQFVFLVSPNEMSGILQNACCQSLVVVWLHFEGKRPFKVCCSYPRIRKERIRNEPNQK